ncbi:MAG TPA: hypothetical protein VM324_01975 [Egibacteraceae bacterium]|jgi:hypothetical protein|nr:hypothetical protein [Egibacteraceae bacterium]
MSTEPTTGGAKNEVASILQGIPNIKVGAGWTVEVVGDRRDYLHTVQAIRQRGCDVTV